MRIFDQYTSNLEFNKLLELVAGLATFEGGRREVAALAPVHSLPALRHTHALITAIRALIEQGEALSFAALGEVRPALQQLGIDDFEMDVRDILRLRDLAECAQRAKATLHAAGEPSELLKELSGQFPHLAGTVTYIDARVDPSGEIPDRASPELAGVRRSLRTLNDQIHAGYQVYLQRAARRGILQDNYITVRNNRFVIPLRTDGQGIIRGVVHGSSSSGMTIYLEPFELVSLNNQFTSQREREAEIIHQILAQISGFLRSQRLDLETAYDRLSALDALAARARLAIRLNCIEPAIGADAALHLEDARHPLLEESLRPQSKTVVPISLEIGPEKHLLIITGPNTGGKTAALKTAGLLTLMALAGIPVPARHMECGLFEQVFAVIGDQQSLTGDLSTFSSHILFLRHILEHYRHPSLILIDEIGVGTDPEEGSALAMAFLDHFRPLQAPVIITTHSQALKEYALTTPGTATAAVEINPETLEPTFALHHGALGGSSGLFIARKLGMPEALIQDANRRLSAKSRLSDDVYAKLNALVRQREAELAAATRIKHDQILKKIELERQAEEKKRETTRQLQEEFRQTLRRFEEEKKLLLEDIRKQTAAPGKLDALERKSNRLASRLQEAIPAIDEGAPSTRPELEALSAAELHPGLNVFIGPLRSEGKVVEVSVDGALVIAGEKKFRLPASWLYRRPVPSQETSNREASTNRVWQEEAAAGDDLPVEINLIGKTVDEALPELDRFLDGAFRQELRRVAVIHGMGKGILREAVHARLRELPFIKAFHHPPRAEGGEGKTIVELDV